MWLVKCRSSLAQDINCTHQVLAHANKVSVGDAIKGIERNAHVLLNACKEIGLAVNMGNTKYNEVVRRQATIANEHIT